MSTEFLHLIADALEKSAAYEDALVEENGVLAAQVALQKEAENKKETDELLQALAIHGDTTLQKEVADKLAAADPALRNWVVDLVKQSASTSLGRSVPNSNGSNTPSYEEDPEGAFLSWLVNDDD